MEKISYSQEIREFKKDLKTVIIPYEKFFNSNKVNNHNTQPLDVLGSEIESLSNFYIKGVGS